MNYLRPLAVSALVLALIVGVAPAGSIAIAAAAPLLRLVDGGRAADSGTDGRLTFLLLGSDTRGGGIARTDTIMVVSLKGKTISTASIPRDMARIPNPAGGTFPGRVNGILETLARGRSIRDALARFTRVIEHSLQIEIDYYALLKFKGFEALVAEVEPIPIGIHRAVRDTGFWDDPSKPRGVYFPGSPNHELYARQPTGEPLCNGHWKSQLGTIDDKYWCHRALPFVRSRKGSGNSDFVRSRRQQDLVVAAMRRVLRRGSGGNLNSLLSRANGEVRNGQLTTNLPLTPSTAADLYSRVNGATVGFQVVFSPSAYATRIAGTTAYELKLSEVRKTAAKWFGGTGSDTPSPTASSGAPSSTPAPVWTPPVGEAGPSPARAATPAAAGAATPSAQPATPVDAGAGTSPPHAAATPAAPDAATSPGNGASPTAGEPARARKPAVGSAPAHPPRSP